MSLGDIGKAVRDSAVGVGWRLVVFSVAALCFSALLTLGTWSASYAPSDVWALKIKEKKLDWSNIVGTAASELARQQRSLQRRPDFTEASLYRALFNHIKEPEFAKNPAFELKSTTQKSKGGAATPENPDRTLLLRYHADLAEREASRKALHDFWTSADTTRAAETPKERRDRRGDLLAHIADLDARIKQSEDGIREAFDTAKSSARFVGARLDKRWQEALIRIGDGNDPLNIVYVIVWYGLEVMIVFLVCLIFVPWLVRLGGDTSDPQALRSKVTEQIKSWIENSFKGLGGRVFGGGVNALAVAAVGGLALAGVTMAAGNPPSLTTLSPPESVAGLKGDKGERGEPGTSSTTEVSCKDGGDCKGSLPGIPPELLKQLADQKTALDTQAREIGTLTERLGEMERQVTENSEHVKSLVATTQIVSTNVGKLSDGMGSVIGHVSTLNGDVSNLNASVGGLALADQSILKTFGVFSHSLAQLDGTAAVTAANVGQVKETVNKASSDLPPTAGDLLRINAKSAGALPRINPFYFYKVTPKVVETMKRAMQGLDEVQTAKIAQALTTVQEQQTKPDGMTLRVWSFEKELHKACVDAGCDKATRDVLDQLMPLIRKLSRV